MGVWIETLMSKLESVSPSVTPFVGVWIETNPGVIGNQYVKVTPFVGVWIETIEQDSNRFDTEVTPFVGVWIETYGEQIKNRFGLSHPSWVCGLKLKIQLSALTKVSHTLRGCVD